MVTGENAQTTRVLGQHRSDAVLGGEISNRCRSVVGLGALIPLGLRQIVGQIGVERLDLFDGLGIFGDLLDLFTREGTQQFHGVTVDVLPGTRIELREQIFGGLVPGPSQVLGQPAQGCDGFWQDGADGKSTYGLHTCEPTGTRAIPSS